MPTVDAELNGKNGEHIPEQLEPYLFHKVALTWKSGDDNAVGDCPFCGKEGKFSILIRNGVWRCFVCDEGEDNGKNAKGGNSYIFLRKLHKLSLESTTDEEYEEIREHRGLLSIESLKAWGVCRSIIDNTTMVPGFNSDGKLIQLYRYVRINGSWKLLATKGLSHGLFGAHLYKADKDANDLCEGPWDGMALWEVKRHAKYNDVGSVIRTGNVKSSLYASTNILATPGCLNFSDKWCKLFANKDVSILYDNDHERNHPKTGSVIESPAFKGVKRVAGALLAAKVNARISYQKWGDKGFDPSLPNGMDVRDVLKQGTDLKQRVRLLNEVLSRVEPIPSDWTGSSIAARPLRGSNELSEGCKPCDSYRALVTQWRKAVKWTDGWDHALASMLASVISVMSVGDQLWLKIIGPASCGKSTLCEALSTNETYVLAKSTMRGFHSGFSDGEEGEDHSLISKVSGKTLVTKDGDTLLQSPNLSQILSEARDVYDTVSRTSYRNKASKNYEGIRMTWLLCGTSSLRSIDQSELGERFLDVVMMDGINDEIEDPILYRTAHRASRNLAIEAGDDKTKQSDPEMQEAKALTGGYVDFLRNNAQDILSQIETTDETLGYCIRLGKFVAHIRARPSEMQEESAERELAARLVSQHVRYAMCLAGVLNKKSLDADVMRRTRQVALDTARGSTLEIVHYIYRQGESGAEPKGIALATHIDTRKVNQLCKFLRRIGVVESFQKTVRGVKHHPRWRLTERMQKLYIDVMGIEEAAEEEVPF